MSNGNDNKSRNSTRECLYGIRSDVASLLTQHKTMQDMIISNQTEIRLGRKEIADVHSRVSSVRDDVNSLRVTLASHVSFSKGVHFAWKRLTAPIIAGLGTGIGVLLVTFWESVVKWIKGNIT